MNKSTGIILAVIVVVIVVAFAITRPVKAPQTTSEQATTTQSAKATTTAATTPKTQQIKTVVVSITNSSFEPKVINVDPGTRVVWVNKDPIPHTVTAAPGGPQSSTLKTGQSYGFLFTKTGIFNYHCSIHPGMSGSVFVGVK